ncbi:MAG: holo-ACP synthase [Armatimonadota bacterium]|nr:holo-ACP synthase [Armatimonadota bacterium]MDR7454215.1 holo-ACP synthase [Armatimonadota bacterium]MDR7512368.1 holo-ACP synthase [Armatimonadota bacterium]
MTLVGIGVDIVEVDRVERAVARWGEAFLRRVYAPAELARAQSAAGRFPRLAARFAAKEAVMKALGVGWRALAWREIEIANDALGRPRVHLHGAARRLADERGITDVLLALSHTHAHAVANAVAVRGPLPTTD